MYTNGTGAAATVPITHTFSAWLSQISLWAAWRSAASPVDCMISLSSYSRFTSSGGSVPASPSVAIQLCQPNAVTLKNAGP